MTPQEFKDFKKLSYSELGKLFGVSKARAYDICLERRGCLRLPEINKILQVSDGYIQPEDIGLEAC